MGTKTQALTATRHVLKNGLVLLVEPLPHVRSVAIGVFVRRGSRHEEPGEEGLAHFIEHLVFKGTKSRTAERIAMDVDAMGGHMDAFTSKEYAAFHLRVLDEQIDRAAEILGDILVSPRFDEADLRKEKTVIFEEFAMVDDTPDDIVGENFARKLWPRHPLGLPILGTRGRIRGYTRDDVRRFFRKVYVPGNLIVSIAGRITEKRALALAERLFGPLKARSRGRRVESPAAASGTVEVRKPELSQVHLCLGAEGPSAQSDERFAATVLGTVLGGSVSSRLFQNIREKRGLVYSISAGSSLFMDTGSFSIYAATSKERLQAVMRHTMDEVKRLMDEPIGADELKRAKDHLKGGLMLGLEGTSSRMSALARSEIYQGRLMSMNEVTRAIDGVTSDQTMALVRRIFDRPLTLSLVGNLGPGPVTAPRAAWAA
jgi:predicted Zn-dependent peptidase